MYKKVYEHFTKDGYVLPDEEKGEFTEEEKFWLVRFPCCPVFAVLMTYVVCRAMSAC